MQIVAALGLSRGCPLVIRVPLIHSETPNSNCPRVRFLMTFRAYFFQKCLLDKTTLKVECFVEYSAQRLKELFSEFGAVEDVLTQSEKKNKIWSALVVMASSTDAAAVASLKGVLEDLSDPLLVLPLQKKDQTSFHKI